MKSSSSADEYRILQYLKPVLQDAIQKLRPERSYSCTQLVKGPLTWREFCKDNSFASGVSMKHYSLALLNIFLCGL